jgi:hypothetical protein
MSVEGVFVEFAITCGSSKQQIDSSQWHIQSKI